MKRAGKVFARRQIYSGLSTHGRIDLREQSRRDLNQRNAAQVNRGRKSGEVAHDASTERNHGIASLETRFAYEAKRLLERAQRLVAFAVRH